MEIHAEYDLAFPVGASVKKLGSAAAPADVESQVFVGDAAQQFEGGDEVALAGAVGADEDGEVAQLDVGGPDRQVALDVDGVDPLARHAITLRPAGQSAFQ